MFKVLLESRGTRERRSLVSVVSACAHAALIVAAAVATTRAEPPPVRPATVDTTLLYHPPRAPERQQRTRVPSAGGAEQRDRPELVEPMPPVGPVSTDGIPPLELTLEMTGAGAVVAPLPAVGPADGAAGPTREAGGVYGPGDRYVEKPAMAAPGSARPRYPEMLRQAGVAGEVEVEFVVDTTGRAEPGSLRILRSDHELFSAAVRSALPAMRFLPAEAGGRRVRQLVRQPFSFAVR